MPLQILYWILMLLWLIFYAVYVYPSNAFLFSGQSVIQFLLFVVIGWKLFGRPVQG